MREVPSSSNMQTGPYAGSPLSPLGESQPPTLLYALSGVALIRAS